MEFASLWWLALPVLLVPIWLHRQKRARTDATRLATARFLPHAEPQVRRVWRWQNWLLLIVRCLLLVTLIAWLADVTLPWRKDAVLVVPGTDQSWLQAQLRGSVFAGAARIELPDREALAWFAEHEREWSRGARIAIAGDVAMPVQRPHFRHEVTLMTRSAAPAQRQVTRHVAIESAAPEPWQRFFAAASDGPVAYVIDSAASASTDLIVWDRPLPPPAGLAAPLWWFTSNSALPPVRQAAPPGMPIVAVADMRGGRAWLVAGDAVTDAAKAAALVEAWQRLHFGVLPYTAPPDRLPPDPHAPLDKRRAGALRHLLMMLLAALFAAERILAHVSRRS